MCSKVKITQAEAVFIICVEVDWKWNSLPQGVDFEDLLKEGCQYLNVFRSYSSHLYFSLDIRSYTMSSTSTGESQFFPNYFSYREGALCDDLSAFKFQGKHGTCNLHAILTLMETKLRMREPTKDKKLAIGPLSVEHVLDKFASEIHRFGKGDVELDNKVREFLKNPGVVFEEDYACAGQNGADDAYDSERAKNFEEQSKGRNLKHIVADNLRAYYRCQYTGSFNGWLRSEIYHNGPILGAFRVREGFQELEKGEYLGPKSEYVKEHGHDVWHTSLLVGWFVRENEEEEEVEVEEFFEIQNAFGLWADKGFGWLMADDVEEVYEWDVDVKYQ